MAIREKLKDGTTRISGGDMSGIPGPAGTRWGSTTVFLFGSSFPNSEVFFPDGGMPRIGDIVVSTNPLGPGAVAVVSGVVDLTHADLSPAYFSIQGPQGPQGIQGVQGPVGSWTTDDTGWIVVGSGGSAPAFGSGWSSRPGWGPLSFRRLNGVVYLRGLGNTATAFTAGSIVVSTIFTLPAGFLPDVVAGGMHLDTTNQGGSCRLQITNSGAVNTSLSTAAVPTGGWWGLDGLDFLAAP